MSKVLKERVILYGVFFIIMGLLLYLMILKEKSDAADKINAFNNNEVLFCNGLIVSKRSGWILLKNAIVKDGTYVRLGECNI